MIGTIRTSPHFIQDECSVNTMPKVKEIPDAIRKQVGELGNEGLTYRQIAEHVQIPYSTVGAIVWKHRKIRIFRELELLARSWCSQCYMLHKVMYEPMTTRSCPQKELELQGVHVS